METNDDSLERFLRAQLWDYEINSFWIINTSVSFLKGKKCVKVSFLEGNVL